MTRADIVKNKGKVLVKIVCDTCGKENYYDIEHFKTAIVNGYDIHCKYCGCKHDIQVYSGDLERRITVWKKRRRKRR